MQWLKQDNHNQRIILWGMPGIFENSRSGKMPWFEKKGLCDQLQRASVSISSNIAEGSAKPSDIEFAHYLDSSLGSAYEVETQLLISKNVGYIDDQTYGSLHQKIVDIERQLFGLIRTLRPHS